MLNIITIILILSAAAMGAAGLYLVMRPARPDREPVKVPAEVITVRKADAGSPGLPSPMSGEAAMPVPAEPAEMPAASDVAPEGDLPDVHAGSGPDTAERIPQGEEVMPEVPPAGPGPGRPEEDTGAAGGPAGEGPEEALTPPPALYDELN